MVHELVQQNAATSVLHSRCMAEKCRVLRQNDGSFYCETHKSSLVCQSLTGDEKPSSLGHVSAWVCLPSGNTYMEAQDL